LYAHINNKRKMKKEKKTVYLEKKNPSVKSNFFLMNSAGGCKHLYHSEQFQIRLLRSRSWENSGLVHPMLYVE
jgi:hypothetical protein